MSSEAGKRADGIQWRLQQFDVPRRKRGDGEEGASGAVLWTDFVVLDGKHHQPVGRLKKFLNTGPSGPLWVGQSTQPSAIIIAAVIRVVMAGCGAVVHAGIRHYVYRI